MKLLAFICAHGALDVANDEEKANVRQFAKGHCDALSTSRRGRTPAGAKLQTALSKAIKEKNTNLATVLVSVEMESASPKDLADAFRLAEESESIELALAALSSRRCKPDDVKLMRNVLKLALKKASPKLTLVACKAGALRGAGAQDMNDVLALALDEAASELAFIACKAFGLSSGCVPKFNPKMVSSALRLGLETDCLELLLFTCTHAANLDLCRSIGEILDGLLQFAVRQSSVELATIVCQAGSFSSLGAETASDVLSP